MGVSLQDAFDAYSHAMEKFANVEEMIMKRGIGSDGHLLRRSSSDEKMESIDHVQFVSLSGLYGSLDLSRIISL